MLLQNADDLFVCKTVALHSLVLSMGQSLLQNGLFQRGKVIWLLLQGANVPADQEHFARAHAVVIIASLIVEEELLEKLKQWRAESSSSDKPTV
jgi:hypothetical protein